MSAPLFPLDNRSAAAVADWLDEAQSELQAWVRSSFGSKVHLLDDPGRLGEAVAEFFHEGSGIRPLGYGFTRLGLKIEHPGERLDFVAKIAWNPWPLPGGGALSGRWKCLYEAALWLAIDEARLPYICPMEALTAGGCLIMRYAEALPPVVAALDLDRETSSITERLQAGEGTEDWVELITELRRRMGDSASIADPSRRWRLSNFGLHDGRLVALEPRARDVVDLEPAVEWVERSIGSGHLQLDRERTRSRMLDELAAEGHPIAIEPAWWTP